jgi:hypothetical protein
VNTPFRRASILLVLAVAFFTFNCSSSPSGLDDPGGCEPNCPITPHLVGESGVQDSLNVGERISCIVGSPTFAPFSNSYEVVVSIVGTDNIPRRVSCVSDNTLPGSPSFYRYRSTPGGWAFAVQAWDEIMVHIGLYPLSGQAVDTMIKTVVVRDGLAAEN